ncbi:MAG: hypothetical protein JWL91_2399 [Sphingomonas bacterium]|nr:UrcA family protein [Sphingomonas bacterium]MDB5690523.1 hypothetical protein [Sphingomonas bacterium]
MQTIRSRSIAVFGAILTTAASLGGISPAHAESYDGTVANQERQAVIALGDVDLSSPKGKAVIQRRIRAAATRVCGPLDREVSIEVMACRRAAIAAARTRLNERAAQQLAAR